MSDFFTERLKSLRKDKNKAAFARDLGIPAPMYHRYENGQIPKEHNLQVIADHCGVTVDWLLGRDDVQLPNTPVRKLDKGGEIEKGQLPNRGVTKLEKGCVREDAPPYGGEPPAVCRYPADCDLQGEINELRDEIHYMRTQLDTVVGLLGAALGDGIRTTRPREGDQRKAG